MIMKYNLIESELSESQWVYVLHLSLNAATRSYGLIQVIDLYIVYQLILQIL